MGKKTRNSQSHLNKSALIRKYQEDFPEAKPKQIAAELKKRHRLNVSPQYVSTILSNERKKSSSSLPNGLGLSADDLYLVKRLVAQTGSVRQAHQAVECYSKLID